MTRLWIGGAVLGALSMTATGCNNACQEICGRMANYAEDCGVTVPDTQIEACIVQQAEVDKDVLKSCRQNGSAEDLRTTWSCEDVLEYFGGGSTPAG